MDEMVDISKDGWKYWNKRLVHFYPIRWQTKCVMMIKTNRTQVSIWNIRIIVKFQFWWLISNQCHWFWFWHNMAIPDVLGSKCLDISLQTTSCIGMSKALCTVDFLESSVSHILRNIESGLVSCIWGEKKLSWCILL